jgi:hypothetical protein
VGVVRAVRRVLLKAQAHLVVGIPQVLTHADTMTQVGNVGWPKAPPPQGFQFTRIWLHRQPDAPDLPDRARQWACEEIRRPSTRQHRGELSITARRVADLVDRMPGLIETCAVPDLDVLGIYEPAQLLPTSPRTSRAMGPLYGSAWCANPLTKSRETAVGATLPARSHDREPSPGATICTAEGPRERAPARRSAWPGASLPPVVEVCRSGRSGTARGTVPGSGCGVHTWSFLFHSW